MDLSSRNILYRIGGLVLGGIFIYAGAIKALDPIRFANDIDNYKILPWAIGVRLAFYLPWLEIFCGIALIFRFLYRGGIVDLNGACLYFYRRNRCRKSPRSRYLLRVFWSRQQKLELHHASRVGFLAADLCSLAFT